MSQVRGRDEHEESKPEERQRVHTTHHLPPAPDPGPRPEPILGVTPGLWPPPFPSDHASPTPQAAFDVTITLANGPPQSRMRITGFTRAAPDVVSHIVGTGILERGESVVISMKNPLDSFLVELADSRQQVAKEVPLSTRESF